MYRVARNAVVALALAVASILPLAAGYGGDAAWRALVAAAAATDTTAVGLDDLDRVRPDIFVVMLDDHAYIPDQRVLERLPDIREHFLEGGLRFEQMHAETPLCGPARATLLSGQHTLRHGVLANDGNPLDQRRTLPVALDEAGYHTVMVGKYLNRWDGTRTPPGWDHMAMAKGSYQPAFWRDGELVNFKPKYVDEAYREQAVTWTAAAPADEPLFLLASVRAPHADQCVNEADRVCYTPRVMQRDQGAEACADIPDFSPPSYSLEHRRGPDQGMPDWPDGWQMRGICESLLVVDRMVGDLVEAQAERGRPAYFVLLSDNGMSWGQHGSPFKRVPWATVTPFYVAGPGVEPGSTDALLSLIDVPATIAELAGADMPWADGESFAGLLAGGEGGREEMLEVMEPLWNGVRTEDLHYVRWADGETELYAYRDDPWQLEDLSDAQPDAVARLDARLDELLEASRA